MIESYERILESYSDGRLSRREAATALLGLAAGTFGLAAASRASGAAQASAPQGSTGPMFHATGLNHLGLRVTDVARSRDFYSETLGMSVIRDNAPGNCFLRSGDHYLGLFRSSAPAVDHFCYTVRDYDADAAMARLQAAGLEPRREEDRVYFDDPDGLEVQLDSRYGSWPGSPPGSEE